MENVTSAVIEGHTGGVKSDNCALYISMQLWYGGKALGPPVLSRRADAPPVWCEWLRTNLPLSDLPLVSFSEQRHG